MKAILILINWGFSLCSLCITDNSPLWAVWLLLAWFAFSTLLLKRGDRKGVFDNIKRKYNKWINLRNMKNIKTIKEAATERMYNLSFPKNKEEFRKMIHQSFCSGAAFAQRWISVDEELLNLKEIVLIRNESDAGIGYRFDDKKFVGKMFSCSHGIVTHWRPVELR
jgi:hypothetical protein